MHEKLKICLGLEVFYPYVDGVVATVDNYARELNKQVACKVLISNLKKDKFDYSKLPYEIIPVKTLFPIGYQGIKAPFLSLKNKKQILRERFNILHVHSPFYFSRVLRRWAKKLKIPLIISFHTKYKDDFEKATKFKFIQKKLMQGMLKNLNHADAVWTVNNSTVQTLREYGFKGEVTIIKNGTDFILPPNKNEIRENMRKKLGINEDEMVFAFVGRIMMYKNLALIADGLKLLLEKGIKFKFLVAGFGEDEDEFKRILTLNGLIDFTIFTGKIIDRVQLSGIYCVPDLLLFPSVFDNSPLVLIEAAAHKLPTLVVKNSSTAEGTIDNVNAFWCENDKEDLAKKLESIVVDKAKLIEVGEGAKRDLFRSWETVVNDVLQNYAKVITDYKRKIDE